MKNKPKLEDWFLGFVVLGFIVGAFWMTYSTGYMNGKWYGSWAQDCVHDGGKVLDNACYSKDVLISTH